MDFKDFFGGEQGYFDSNSFAAKPFFEDFSSYSWEEISCFCHRQDLHFVSSRQFIANIKWIREQHLLDLPKDDHSTSTSLDSTADSSSQFDPDFLLLQLPKDFLILKDHSFNISKSSFIALLEIYSWYLSSDTFLNSQELTFLPHPRKIKEVISFFEDFQDDTHFLVQSLKKRFIFLLPFLVLKILDEIVAHLEIPEEINSPEQLILVRNLFFISPIQISSIQSFSADDGLTTQETQISSTDSLNSFTIDSFPFEILFDSNKAKVNFFLDGLLKMLLLDATSSSHFNTLAGKTALHKKNKERKVKESYRNHLFVVSSTIVPFHSFRWHDVLAWKEMTPTQRLDYLEKYRSSQGKYLYKSELQDQSNSSSYFFSLSPSRLDSLYKGSSFASRNDFSSVNQLLESITKKLTTDQRMTGSTKFPLETEEACDEFKKTMISLSKSNIDLTIYLSESSSYSMGCFPETLSNIFGLKKQDYYSQDEMVAQEAPSIEGVRFTMIPKPTVTTTLSSTNSHSPTVASQSNHSVASQSNHSVASQSNHSVATQSNHSVATQSNHSVATQSNHSVASNDSSPTIPSIFNRPTNLFYEQRRSTYESFLWFLITMSFWQNVYCSESSFPMPKKVRTAFERNDFLSLFPFLETKDRLIHAYNLGMAGEKEFITTINFITLASSQLVKECTNQTFLEHILFV
uniref:Uncharacterized protein n=1 Tax=Jakoba libera TaxID=143017 RepID=M4QL43_JAKLI|nr:hypothetical protein L048_p083 [Jakoba libera]AGH24173.1 hypothetical protein [Jakoba libera]